MSDAQRLITAREQVLTAALKLLGAERSLSQARAVPVLLASEAELYLACRNVTRAVDDMEPVKRPKGWTA